jgi:hypothetical protein
MMLSATDLTEMHLDDVLVAGQHQAFRRHVAAPVRAIADLGDLLILHRHHDDVADRPRPVHVEAGQRAAGVAAEHEVQRDLVGLHGVERAKRHPQDQKRQRDRHDRFCAHASARQTLEILLQASDRVFNVVGAWRPAGARAPGALSPGLPRAALVVPGHAASVAALAAAVGLIGEGGGSGHARRQGVGRGRRALRRRGFRPPARQAGRDRVPDSKAQTVGGGESQEQRRAQSRLEPEKRDRHGQLRRASRGHRGDDEPAEPMRGLRMRAEEKIGIGVGGQRESDKGEAGCDPQDGGATHDELRRWSS